MENTDPLVGQEVDGYRIGAMLGRGGMGVVYQAEDVALSRTVALKMIHPAYASDALFVRRFEAEARAIARVDSPHIVAVHALRRTAQGLFIVMEHVAGGTVADRLRTGPLAVGDALSIMRQLLRALDEAHGVGVIHRDIKPANLLLTEGGVVKVTDFGLAKVQTGSGMSTMTQGVAGTLYYMAPEQVRGQTADHRTDLYAAGMTLYEMLCGGVPFDRETADFDVMQTIVEGRIPPLGDVKPELPPALVALVMQAVSADPEARFQGAAEMQAALDAFEASWNKGAVEVRVTPRRAAPAPRKGRRAVAVVLALVALLALAWWGWQSFAPPALEDPAVAFSAADSLPVPPDTTTLVQGAQPDTADTVAPAAPAANVDQGATTSRRETPTAGRDTQEANREEASSTPPSQPPVQPPATLVVSTVPEASMYVDGRLTRTGVVEVPPGAHTVRVVHHEHGACAEEVRVEAGRRYPMTCYFNHTISIGTALSEGVGEAPWVSLWVNGKDINVTTPRTLDFTPGTYTIEARKVGYEVVTPPQTLVIVPSFEKKAHQIVFRIRKQL